ncbi:MAG: glutathione S-transferase family protein [Alphaproteobacteria bacterium]|nr:glutathione S-transferase family protein [Alphaproteobacteria bacterium]
MTSQFILHGLSFSGPTYKVGLMLRLCQQAFSYRHVDLRSGIHKAPSFLKLNRYGQVPVLQHGDLVLCQSNAILEYLSETLVKFGGRTPQDRAHVREWLFWDFEKLSLGIFRTRSHVRGFRPMDAAVASNFRDLALSSLSELDKNLLGKNFLVGSQPTIADIACYGVIVFAEEAQLDLTNYPCVKAWMDRMASLPGWKLPYDLLPQTDAISVAA